MSLLTGQDTTTPPGNQGSGAGGGTGNQTVTDWRAKLPEDLRSEKVFESIKGKDWDEAGPILAKNYKHAQSMIGADKLVLPTATSTPEERAAFYTKLGRPEKPDGYAIKLPEGLQETQLDKARVDEWRKEMHEAGLPKDAAERLLNKYLTSEFEATRARDTAAIKQIEQHEMAIKQEFGAKFEEQVNFARYAVKEFGSDAVKEMFDSTGLGSHPDVFKMFAKIGQALTDDRARNGGERQTHASTPEAAQAALNEFNKNSDNTKALFDKAHPNHDRVVAERRKLFETAFGVTMK